MLHPLFQKILAPYTNQKFNEAEANRRFPKGCTCPDDSGSCGWCTVYYATCCCEVKSPCPIHGWENVWN